MSRDFERYLAAKRTVDDRAIDRRTADRLRAEFRRMERLDVLKILEVGAGTGAMVERLLGDEALPDRVEYTAVDVDREVLETARERLPDRLGEQGYETSQREERLVFERGSRTVTLELVADDAVAFVRGEYEHGSSLGRTWNLLVGHAVLDVIGLDAIRPLLSAVPGGLCYFPVTFDGATRFEPRHPLDDRIERRYHRQMDEAREGTSRAGHRTLTRILDTDVDVLAVGGSDWVVHPVDGEYPGDEAYFLQYIVNTISNALSGVGASNRGENGDDEPQDGALENWVESRHRQIEEASLTYIAHQLDLLGRVPHSVIDGNGREG